MVGVANAVPQYEIVISNRTLFIFADLSICKCPKDLVVACQAMLESIFECNELIFLQRHTASQIRYLYSIKKSDETLDQLLEEKDAHINMATWGCWPYSNVNNLEPETLQIQTRNKFWVQKKNPNMMP